MARFHLKTHIVTGKSGNLFEADSAISTAGVFESLLILCQNTGAQSSAFLCIILIASA